MIASPSQFNSEVEVLDSSPLVNVVQPLRPESATRPAESFLESFDAAKHEFDYSSTSTAFNLPHTHPFPEIQPNGKYTLQHIATDHPSFSPEISRIFLTHLMRTKLVQNIKFIDGTRINNTKMHDNLMLCRSILAAAGEKSDFTFLFHLTPGYDPVYEDHVFSNGIKCGNMPAEYLGNPSTGVLLSCHPDTCTLAPLMPFVPHRMIIFKALYGAAKFVPVNSKTYPQNEIPRESFGANIAIDERGADNMFDMFTQSLVYIYDKRDSSGFYQYPRTLYPYAVVSFYIDTIYYPPTPLRLPWSPKNICLKTTFNFDPCFRIPVEVYRLYDNNSTISELAIDGISVRKMITFGDLGNWDVLRGFFSGAHGSFYSTDQIHLQSSYSSTDYFISHCMIASDDPRFVKIARGMLIPQLGAVISVPNIPKFSQSDSNGGRSCGFLLPNSNFSSLFGVPNIPGDVLHCFIVHKVVIATLNAHPLRTIKREESLRLLINMPKCQKISRSDKVSDNDVRVALFNTVQNQILSIENLLENCSSEMEREMNRKQILQHLLMYQEPFLSTEHCENVENAEEREFENHIIENLTKRRSFIPVGMPQPPPRKLYDHHEIVPRFSRMPKASASSSSAMMDDEKMDVDFPALPTVYYEPGTCKTAVILDPRIILDTQIDPSILESLLKLSTECTKNVLLSKFTVIYHQCMRGTRLAENGNITRAIVNPQRVTQYQRLEDKYANEQTIQFAPEHTCDSKRTALRAAVVCILTILRKYSFNNAVLLTYAAITDEAIFFQQHKTCLMTPEEYIEKLKAKDASFLF